MYEDVDFGTIEGGQGIKFVVSSVNWTMCRPELDDYNNSISKLIQGMKEKGKQTIICKKNTYQALCVRYTDSIKEPLREPFFVVFSKI